MKNEEADLDEQGGSILKVKKRPIKKRPKVDEALQKQMQGGAILKSKKRSPKKKPKVDEALEKQMQGGKMKYHDRMHKHLQSTWMAVCGFSYPRFAPKGRKVN